MTARMKNPAICLPEVQQAIMGLGQASGEWGIPQPTLELVHTRVSQINGCAFCLDLGARTAQGGVTDAQLTVLPGWRETELFSDAERAALDLAEHMTRFADRSDPVPDRVWDAAAEQYEERQLAGLVTWIAMNNMANRLNVTTRQPPGGF